MRPLLRSAGSFGRGVARHFAWLVPGALLGVLDVVERATGETIRVAPWIFWSTLGAGLFVSAFLTYHDLRKAVVPGDEQLRQALRAVEEHILRYRTTLKRARERGHYEDGESFATVRWPDVQSVLAAKLGGPSFSAIRDVYRGADDMNQGLSQIGLMRHLVGDEDQFEILIDKADGAVQGELGKLGE